MARNLLRFTPAPSPQNVTGEKSLIDTYGEDVSMMVFMCFTVLLSMKWNAINTFYIDIRDTKVSPVSRLGYSKSLGGGFEVGI